MARTSPLEIRSAAESDPLALAASGILRGLSEGISSREKRDIAALKGIQKGLQPNAIDRLLAIQEIKESQDREDRGAIPVGTTQALIQRLGGRRTRGAPAAVKPSMAAAADRLIKQQIEPGAVPIGQEDEGDVEVTDTTDQVRAATEEVKPELSPIAEEARQRELGKDPSRIAEETRKADIKQRQKIDELDNQLRGMAATDLSGKSSAVLNSVSADNPTLSLFNLEMMEASGDPNAKRLKPIIEKLQKARAKAANVKIDKKDIEFGKFLGETALELTKNELFLQLENEGTQSEDFIRRLITSGALDPDGRDPELIVTRISVLIRAIREREAGQGG